jgi:large subunit ribosomal protein L10
MSRPVKALLRKDLVGRLKGAKSLAVLSLTGVDGASNNQLRRGLRGQAIHLTVVKNSVARQALVELGLDSACALVEGPCALAYPVHPEGVEVVAIVRFLLEQGKHIPALTVRGALMDGEVFGPERVEALSKYPTRAEAISRLAALLLSPGGRLAGILLAPGGRLASALKTVEERAGGGGDEGGEILPSPVPGADVPPEGQAAVPAEPEKSPGDEKQNEKQDQKQ